MELILPNNYVELEQEEMMYVDGGWGLGKHWWNSTWFVGRVLDAAIFVFTGYTSSGRNALDFIKGNLSKISQMLTKRFGKRAYDIVRMLVGVANKFLTLSVCFIIANAVDYLDGFIGCSGFNGYCFE